MNPWLYPILPTSQLIQLTTFIEDNPALPPQLALSRARSNYLRSLYDRLSRSGYELPSSAALEAFVSTGYRHDDDLGAHRYDFSFPGVRWDQPYGVLFIDPLWRVEKRAHPGGPLTYAVATPATTGADPGGDYPTETRQLIRYLDLHKGTIVAFTDWPVDGHERYDSRAVGYDIPEVTAR